MSYVSSYFHCVFSTKERRPHITLKLREKLWPYLGGIARQNKFKAIEIGGVEDHVHVLLSLPATVSIAKAMQLLKGGSSKWIHETFVEHRLFAWQEEHHRKQSFKEEFVALLTRHRIPFDEKYLWD